MFEKLLSTPTAQVGRVGRFLVFQVKLWIHCFRLLKKNRSGQQAAALSYYTVFGLVPLAVVMLMAFQLFPMYNDIGQNIKMTIYGELRLSTIEYPDAANPEVKIKLTDNIDALIGKIFSGLNTGRIAVLGGLLIIAAALMMLVTIEGAFNIIWGVGKGRGIVHRVVNYWALLTLVPILVATAIWVATKYSAINEIQKTIVSHTTPVVVSYLVVVVCIFAVYLVLPNTKVKARAAIWGAIVAALVWTIAKWGFKLYVTKFIPYNELYGVLGLIPLGVFWIYISWYIVLFGLQLTYTSQHLHTLDQAQIEEANKGEEYFIASELTVMNIMSEIASAFVRGGGASEPATVADKLEMPQDLVEKIMRHFVSAGFLVRVSEPKDGFMPAMDPAAMKLGDIAEAVNRASFAHQPEEQSEGLKRVSKLQNEMFSRFTVKELLESKSAAGI
jgi:membrane protein